MNVQFLAVCIRKLKEGGVPASHDSQLHVQMKEDLQYQAKSLLLALS